MQRNIAAMMMITIITLILVLNMKSILSEITEIASIRPTPIERVPHRKTLFGLLDEYTTYTWNKPNLTIHFDHDNIKGLKDTMAVPLDEGVERIKKYLLLDSIEGGRRHIEQVVIQNENQVDIVFENNESLDKNWAVCLTNVIFTNQDYVLGNATNGIRCVGVFRNGIFSEVIEKTHNRIWDTDFKQAQLDYSFENSGATEQLTISLTSNDQGYFIYKADTLDEYTFDQIIEMEYFSGICLTLTETHIQYSESWNDTGLIFRAESWKDYNLLTDPLPTLYVGLVEQTTQKVHIQQVGTQLELPEPFNSMLDSNCQLDMFNVTDMNKIKQSLKHNANVPECDYLVYLINENGLNFYDRELDAFKPLYLKLDPTTFPAIEVHEGYARFQNLRNVSTAMHGVSKIEDLYNEIKKDGVSDTTALSAMSAYVFNDVYYLNPDEDLQNITMNSETTRHRLFHITHPEDKACVSLNSSTQWTKEVSIIEPTYTLQSSSMEPYHGIFKIILSIECDAQADCYLNVSCPCCTNKDFIQIQNDTTKEIHLEASCSSTSVIIDKVDRKSLYGSTPTVVVVSSTTTHSCYGESIATSCSLHGSCQSQDVCVCDPGYSGNMCNLTACWGLEYDNVNVCSGHGTCEGPNQCNCQGGYMKPNCSTFQCNSIESTHPRVCGGQGTCLDSGVCDCNDGYGGDSCVKMYCNGIMYNDTSVCSGSGKCIDGQCHCVNGREGENCEMVNCTTSCKSEKPCEWNLNSGICNCHHEYTNFDCIQPICFGISGVNSCNGFFGDCITFDQCECRTGKAGKECTEPHVCQGKAFNDPDVCNNNGTCSKLNECECNEMYGGVECTIYKCYGIIHTSNDVCSGHGDCLEIDQCSCSDPSHYEGVNCNETTCHGVSNMDENVCSNHGSCMVYDQCQCDEYYLGTTCDVFQCMGKLSNDSSQCSMHGSCSTPNQCTCDTNYGGDHCSVTQCGGVLNTNATVCSAHGQCSEYNQCECAENYFGTNCEVTNCIGQLSNSSNTCSSHGTCHSSNECTCDLHFTGALCNITSCFGVFNNQTNVCSNHGTCQEYNSCECESGYNGDSCDVLSCLNTFSNDSSACSSHGACLNPNHCTCDTHFYGTFCNITSCQNVFNNQSNVCSNHGTCQEYNSCECESGYNGDSCDILSCLDTFSNDSNACSAHGTCLNPNQCTCDSHYVEFHCNITSCHGVFNNQTSVCSNHGTCHEYNSCQCEDGYVGIDCSVITCFETFSNDTNACSGKGLCSTPNKCTCNEHYFGERCQLTTCSGTLNNDTSVCSEHGECADYNTCACQEKYYGYTCNYHQCHLKLSNETNVCSGHGQCDIANNCTCVANYSGTYCNLTTCFVVANSNSDVCSGHGLCFSLDDCTCSDHYFGNYCNETTCFGTLFNDSTVCSGHGSCSTFDTCSCDGNYIGSSCETTSCFQIQSNDTKVCNERGQCVSFDQCECDEYYDGSTCNKTTCYSRSNEDPHVCSGHGQCTEYDTCECIHGWKGNTCQMMNFPTCYGIDKNSPWACSSNGRCLAKDTCECYFGVTGDNCEQYSCFSVNATDKNVCSGHGQCKSPNHCFCFPDWGGRECEEKICGARREIHLRHNSHSVWWYSSGHFNPMSSVQNHSIFLHSTKWDTLREIKDFHCDFDRSNPWKPCRYYNTFLYQNYDYIRACGNPISYFGFSKVEQDYCCFDVPLPFFSECIQPKPHLFNSSIDVNPSSTNFSISITFNYPNNHKWSQDAAMTCPGFKLSKKYIINNLARFVLTPILPKKYIVSRETHSSIYRKVKVDFRRCTLQRPQKCASPHRNFGATKSSPGDSNNIELLPLITVTDDPENVTYNSERIIPLSIDKESIISKNVSQYGPLVFIAWFLHIFALSTISLFYVYFHYCQNRFLHFEGLYASKSNAIDESNAQNFDLTLPQSPDPDLASS